MEFAKNIHSAGSDLNLINDIHLSKIESGTVTVEAEERPSCLCVSVERNFKHIAEQKNLRSIWSSTPACRGRSRPT